MAIAPSRVNNHLLFTMVKLSSLLRPNQALGGCQKQMQHNTPTASLVGEKSVTPWALVSVMFNHHFTKYSQG